MILSRQNWFLLTSAVLTLLSLRSFAADTAEDEEAKRIQIGTTQTGAEVQTVTIFAAGGRTPTVSVWHGCKAEIDADKGGALILSSVPETKLWAGCKLLAAADEGTIPLRSAGDLGQVRLKIRVKGEPGADLTRLQLCVYGKNAAGKPAQSDWLWQALKTLSPADASGWRETTLELKRFEKAESLQDLSGVGIQFIENGPGAPVHVESLQLTRQLSRTASLHFQIETPQPTQGPVATGEYPPSASNIRIAGPDIVREGSPVFLTGVEDDAIVFPWLYRLLALDVVHLQDFAPTNKLDFALKGDEVTVKWRPMPQWLDTKMRRLLTNGFALHLNFWDNTPTSPAFRESFADALAETSHFYSLRLDHPLGKELKEKYLLAEARDTGKYPVTFYELYNELFYGDASPQAVKDFQQELAQRYGDIDRINAIFGTHFSSLEKLSPPRKKVNWLVTQKDIAIPDGSLNFYCEWQKFVERRLGKELSSLTKTVKQALPFAGANVTYQATMALGEDYSGFPGTEPHQLAKAEDVLCQEGGMTFIPQDQGAENIREIAKMARPLLVWDLLKGLSRDKPVYLSECTVGAVGKSYEPAAAVLDLTGGWRFFDASGSDDTAPAATGFDDRSWREILMPGVWGNQGYPTCTRGWLRKTFDRPAEAGPIFLTGRELADFAQVYLNGKLLISTTRWNEGFSIEVGALLKPQGNVLACRIDNQFVVEGQTQGGIRGLLALTSRKFFDSPLLTAGQMRSWFWSMAAHDVSGVIMSYFYTPAASKEVASLYSPLHTSYEAIRAIPAVKKEILSVAPALLPRPRLKGEVAVVYPLETGRAHLPKNTTSLFSGPLTLHVMEYYLAALFSRITPEVATCPDILAGKTDGYKTLVFTGCPRVPGALPEKLEAYVRTGGTLIVDANSISYDDDAYGPIPTPVWFGVQIGEERKASDTLHSTLFGLKKAPAQERSFAAGTGVSLRCTGAETLATYADGTPAITVNHHGKGAVYYLAAKLPYPQLKRVLTAILTQSGCRPEVQITPENNGNVDYLEAHLLGREGQYVCYLNQFGGGELRVRIGCPQLSEGTYAVTDLQTGKPVAERFTAAELHAGLKVTVPSQNPVTLLVQRLDASPQLVVQKLSAEDEAALACWRKSPAGKVKVLVNACARDEIDPFRMLSGKKMLEDEGYEFHYASDLPRKGMVKAFYETDDLRPLADYPVYMLAGSRIRSPDNIAAIQEYVKNGGSILLSATVNIGYFGWMSNTWNRKDLLRSFGLECTDNNLRDAKNFHFAPEFPTLTDIQADHPLTRGISKIQTVGGCELRTTTNDQHVLARVGTGNTGAPFLIAFSYGKGRVVAMADAQWLEPEWLKQADNTQLMKNIFAWLSEAH